MSHVAIIGGSGVYNLDKVKVLEELEIETPFGKPSGKILKLEINNSQFYFLPRHGVGHAINPSEINYRANIYALKSIGITNIISISAVGSLKEEHNPGKFVLVDQFIDWTKGLRKRSFFDDGVVGHVSCANPINENLKNRISKLASETDLSFSVNGTYICIEGPQFSTRAESNIYRSFQADVIGMTNVPEAFLAKEAGIAYATVAMVTDYDCWKEEHCTVDEIMKVMSQNYLSAQILIEKIIPSLVKDPILFEKENQFAIVTNPNLISSEKNKVLSLLLK